MDEDDVSIPPNIARWNITLPPLGVEQQGSVTFFRIVICPGSAFRTWWIRKRYSEIRAFWDVLQSQGIPASLLGSSSPQFPWKHIIACRGRLLEARRFGLESFLQLLATRLESGPSAELLRTFLTDGRQFHVETEEIFKDLAADHVFRIENAEERGITLDQLRSILKHVRRRCETERWQSTHKDNSIHLTPSTANLYDIVHHVVNPATRFQQCSFVELVTNGLQVPKYFISHWWGEPIIDFVSCVERHLKVRNARSTTAYWVCAYANNQHQLGKDLGNDPRDSSFFKAMHLSSGVLLILDRQGTPFKRIWCCFEEAVVISGLDVNREYPLLLDIATVSKDGPQLLTDGLTAEEEHLDQLLQEGRFEEVRATYPELCKQFTGREDGLSGWRLKSEREAAFPLEVIRPCCELDITKADASHHVDKVKILNALASRPASDLEREPNLELPLYNRMNCKLRGVFGTGPAVWRRAISQDIDISGPTASLPLLRTLQEDVERTEFTLILSSVDTVDDSHAQVIGKSLVHLRQLRVLHLNFAKTKITRIDEISKGIQHLYSLNTLKLEFPFCEHLIAISDFGDGLASLSSLKSLHLDFQNCNGLSTVIEIGQALATLCDLTFVHLDFSGCHCLTTMDEVGLGLRNTSKMQEFTLGLDLCSHVTSMDEVASAVANLQDLTVVRLQVAGTTQNIADQLGRSLGKLCSHSLRALRLDMWNSVSIKNSEEIGKGLANLRNLREIHMDFDGCRSMNSIRDIAQSLSYLNNLASLKFSLSECSSLRSVGELASALSGLSNLSMLDLNFDRCRNIFDFGSLGKSLFHIDSLVHLKLNFRVCDGLATLTEVGQGLANLVRLRSLEVNCEFCTELTSVKEVGDGLTNLAVLVKLELNFFGCNNLCTVDSRDTPLRNQRVSLDHLTVRLPWRDR